MAIVHQRTALGNFEQLEYEELAASIPLPSIDCSLSLVDVYRNVELVEENEHDKLEHGD